eukprot:SAG22_NODE_729_length_7596_cov_20.310924_1_plen_72_part_00
MGSDGDLWKYWGDAVRADGKPGGGAAAALLASGRAPPGRKGEWKVAAGPDWQGPIWEWQAAEAGAGGAAKL